MTMVDDVAIPIFSSPVYIERSRNIPLDSEEEFLSPEERILKRKEEQQKKKNYFQKNQQLASRPDFFVIKQAYSNLF